MLPALCSRTMMPHVFVFTTKPVRQGQEALLDYGPVSAHPLPAVLMLHQSFLTFPGQAWPHLRPTLHLITVINEQALHGMLMCIAIAFIGLSEPVLGSLQLFRHLPKGGGGVLADYPCIYRSTA